MKHLFYKQNGLIWLIVAALVFIVDFFTKIYVHAYFYYGESIRIFNFFSFSYARNTGAAFSILEGQKWPLIAIALAMSGFIIYMLIKNYKNKCIENLGLSLILGGALGNVFDRCYYGYVVDFFDFNFGSWHYPTFNVADIAICIGIGFYFIASFKAKK